MGLVFFGSGPVAAASLKLLAQQFEIEAVITKPRAAHHRGPVPVIELSTSLGLPILTAGSKKELDELFAGQPVKSKLAILIDFGIIVSRQIIDYFPLGIINSHFSILPEWRGADPITFAILSGQQETGVSLMYLVEAMDEGPLLGYGVQPLDGTETTTVLTEHLVLLSDALLRQHIPEVLAGSTAAAPQEITKRQVSYSRKLTKDDGIIDWHKPAEQIEREIRAFIEWPKSRTTLAGKEVIVTRAHAAKKQETGNRKQEMGKFFVTPDKELAVQTGGGLLIIDSLKPAGKQEMTGKAFLAGYGHLIEKRA